MTMTSSNFYARTLYELSELLTRLLGAPSSGCFVIEILISRDWNTCNKIKPNCNNINHNKKRQHHSNYVAHKAGAKRYGPVPSAHQVNPACPLPIRSNEHVGIYLFIFFNQRQTLPGEVGKGERTQMTVWLVWCLTEWTRMGWVRGLIDLTPESEAVATHLPQRSGFILITLISFWKETFQRVQRCDSEKETSRDAKKGIKPKPQPVAGSSQTSVEGQSCNFSSSRFKTGVVSKHDWQLDYWLCCNPGWEVNVTMLEIRTNQNFEFWFLNQRGSELLNNVLCIR